MKTKFKTSTKSKKESILENGNFLNNQNYILGKSEKKKLLSKFFVEKIMYTILGKINLFTTVFFPLLIISLLINIFIFGFVFNIDVSFYLILSTTILIGVIISFFYNIKNNNIKLKEYFLSESSNLFSIILIFFGIFLLLMIAFGGLKSINGFYFNNYISYINYWIIPLIGILIYFYKKTIILFRINYIGILLLPINLIIFLVYGFYIFIKYSINGIKSFKFIKYSPNINLIKKFSKIKKYYAENKYYKIQIKK